MEIDAGRGLAGSRTVLLGRFVNVVAVVLVVLWSARWLPLVFSMVQEQTEFGRAGLAALSTGYAVFELLFVAGYGLVRWLPGVAAIAAAAWLTRWWLRRA
jgi:hypothetical protein